MGFVLIENLPKDFQTRLEMLPFLHYGFAALNLVYIPLGIIGIDLFEWLISQEEVSRLLIEAYGTDFSFLLSSVSWLHGFSIVYFIISAGLNVWVAKSLFIPKRYKWIKQVEWLNIGLIPLGTALAILSLSVIKRVELLEAKEECG